MVKLDIPRICWTQDSRLRFISILLASTAILFGLPILAAGQPVDGTSAGGAFATEASLDAGGFVSVNTSLAFVGWNAAAWGDYDGDGDLDILVTGYSGALGHLARVYRNDGNDDFTDIEAGLEGVESGAVAWGDYDNDGDLDILLTGTSYGVGNVSLVYRNDGGSFADIGAGLPGLRNSAVAWGDYDNDGDLDILLSGDAGFGYISRIYRNDAGTFTDILAGLLGVQNSFVAWGDYDNDGDLDLVLSGRKGAGLRITHVYRNDGGTFTDIGPLLAEASYVPVAWGDYDSDGDLDILTAGSTPLGFLTPIYRNDDGVFTGIVVGLASMRYGLVAWGDCDNDGDLDALLASLTDGFTRIYRNDGGVFADSGAVLPWLGSDQSSMAWGDYDDDGDLDILFAGSKVYRNDTPVQNTPPTAPSNLSEGAVGRVIALRWDAASDEQTPASGLSYNLRVGKSPGSGDVCSGMANAVTGHRDVPQLGNVNHNLSWNISIPETGRYYWSVQAVDASFAGGPFAPEHSFVVNLATGVPDAPNLQHRTRLLAAVPNPFNPRTTIRFELEHTVHVDLSVFDVTGRLVATLVDATRPAGMNEVLWQGRDAQGQKVATGVYLYRLRAGDFVATRRMVLLK